MLKSISRGLVIAAALLATPATATSLIDFENYNVGDVPPNTLSGGDYPFYFAPQSGYSMIVAAPGLGTGNVLQLGTKANAFGLPNQFVANLGPYIIEPHKKFYTPKIVSLDIWVPTLGDAHFTTGPTAGEFSGGEWFTWTPEKQLSQELTYLVLRSADTTIYLDNIVLVDGVTAVPEPSIWALMITGFGLAGAALRRRRTAAVA